MASDLKLEIFALNSFCRVLEKENLNICQIYGEECCKVENIFEACEDILTAGIALRRMMFNSIYGSNLPDEKEKRFKSLSAYYDYVTSLCDRSDFFGHLPVFERAFATCGFILDLCIRIYLDYNVDIIKYGHIFWAMYFDKFTEEFYEKGGWEQLKKLAETYNKIRDAFYHFEGKTLYEIKMAIENYCKFKDNAHFDEYKSKQKKKFHVSKFWVKHCIERFDSYIVIPLHYQYSFNVLEAEKLLENLINLHEPSIEESAFSTETECIEIMTDYVDKKIHKGCLPSQDLPRIPSIRQFTDTYIDDLNLKKSERIGESFNVSKTLDSKWVDKCLSPKKFPPYKVLDAIYCSENGEISQSDEKANKQMSLEMSNYSTKEHQMEIARKVDIISTDQIIKSAVDKNYSSSILPTDLLYSSDITLTDQTDVSLCCRKSSSNVTNTKKICLESEYVNGKVEDLISNAEIVNNEKSEEMSHDSKNGDSSTSQITKSDDDGKFSLCNFPTQQFIDSFTENLYSRNTGRQIPTAAEVSLTEQTDVSLDYPQKHKNTLNFSSKNPELSGKDAEVNNDKILKGNAQTEITKVQEIKLRNQMDVCEGNSKTTPDIYLKSKDLDFVNCENMGEDKEKVEKVREEFKKEQDDRDINIFLRMILILNDRQGTQFVLQELRGNEGPKNIQVIAKKQKKKSKKSKKHNKVQSLLVNNDSKCHDSVP